jgi:hypothetical protein
VALTNGDGGGRCLMREVAHGGENLVSGSGKVVWEG